MTGPRRGLGFWIALVTVGVAVLSLVVAASVTYGLVRSSAETEARRQLGRQADLVAGLAPARTVSPRVRRLLRESGTRLVLYLPDGGVRGRVTLPARDRRALLAGAPVSRVEPVAGRRSFVEGRPLAVGGAAVLVQPAASAAGPQAEFVRRVLLATLIGLVAALLAGALLGRRLARPLRETAAGADRLASGERNFRVRPAGPTEVARVAEAVNALAQALAASEGRQREFLLSISHELRTPLTAIKGFAEALADGVTTDADVAPAGRLMLGEADRLQRLIGDLLDLARLEADDFRVTLVTVDLTALLRDAADTWTPRCAAAGITLRAELPGGPVETRSDPGRLRQIVDGLMENALRVTPEGGVMVLALRPYAGAATVEVRDSGPGLTEEDIGVAFQRSVLYQRYRGVRPAGTGFGLAIVDRLAVHLGGRAEAGHAPEGGARFGVHLPRPR
ncbi:MAG TPA: HAMP domain-containing sensor histidine kinase [Streptosporangiaceae bacterium]|jgi:two-component system sensor histidine kinase BaeS